MLATALRSFQTSPYPLPPKEGNSTRHSRRRLRSPPPFCFYELRCQQPPGPFHSLHATTSWLVIQALSYFCAAGLAVRCNETSCDAKCQTGTQRTHLLWKVGCHAYGASGGGLPTKVGIGNSCCRERKVEYIFPVYTVDQTGVSRAGKKQLLPLAASSFLYCDSTSPVRGPRDVLHTLGW